MADKKTTAQTLLEIVVKQHDEVMERFNTFEIEFVKWQASIETRIKTLEDRDRNSDRTNAKWRERFWGVLSALTAGITLALILAALGLSGCTSQSAPPSLIITNTPVVIATATRPVSTTIAATPTPAEWMQYAYNPNNDMLPQYYEPSSERFAGFATRWGDDQEAFTLLHWIAIEAAAQHRRGWVLYGGGYKEVDGHWVESRSDPVYAVLADTFAGSQSLTENQKFLLDLAAMTPVEFAAATAFADGVVALRSPNDLGRVYCLYSLLDNKEAMLGTVIVGDTAIRNDWLPYGASFNNDPYDHPRLGDRVLIDSTGKEWRWAVDLPNSLYYKAWRDKDGALVGLIEGQCPE